MLLLIRFTAYLRTLKREDLIDESGGCEVKVIENQGVKYPGKGIGIPLFTGWGKVPAAPPGKREKRFFPSWPESDRFCSKDSRYGLSSDEG